MGIRAAAILVALAGCSTDLPRKAADAGPEATPETGIDAPSDGVASDATDAAADLTAAEPGADLSIDAPPLVDASLDAPVDSTPDGVTCPDGSCDIAMGEDDFSCPQDCGCTAVVSCNDLAPFGCACDVCSIMLSNNCLDADTACGVPADPCSNGVCDYCEDVTTCPGDCS